MSGFRESPNVTQRPAAEGLTPSPVVARFPPWFMADLKHEINILCRFFSYHTEVSIFFEKRYKINLGDKAWSISKEYNWKVRNTHVQSRATSLITFSRGRDEVQPVLWPQKSILSANFKSHFIKNKLLPAILPLNELQHL